MGHKEEWFSHGNVVRYRGFFIMYNSQTTNWEVWVRVPEGIQYMGEKPSKKEAEEALDEFIELNRNTGAFPPGFGIDE